MDCAFSPSSYSFLSPDPLGLSTGFTVVVNQQELHQIFTVATIPEQHSSRDLKERFQGGLLYPQKTSDGGSNAEEVCTAHGPSSVGAGLSTFQTTPFLLNGGEVKLLFINPFVRSKNSGALRMPHLT